MPRSDVVPRERCSDIAPASSACKEALRKLVGRGSSVVGELYRMGDPQVTLEWVNELQGLGPCGEGTRSPVGGIS